MNKITSLRIKRNNSQDIKIHTISDTPANYNVMLVSDLGEGIDGKVHFELKSGAEPQL